MKKMKTLNSELSVKNDTNEILTLIIEPRYVTYEIGKGEKAVIRDEFDELYMIVSSGNCISIYASEAAVLFVDGIPILPV